MNSAYWLKGALGLEPGTWSRLETLALESPPFREKSPLWRRQQWHAEGGFQNNSGAEVSRGVAASPACSRRAMLWLVEFHTRITIWYTLLFHVCLASGSKLQNIRGVMFSLASSHGSPTYSILKFLSMVCHCIYWPQVMFFFSDNKKGLKLPRESQNGHKALLSMITRRFLDISCAGFPCINSAPKRWNVWNTGWSP